MDDQLPDDGLKWFGEGFDGFPKRLPDDCVEYIIQVIDEKLENAAAVRARLNEINKAANELKKKHLKDYIWQRDAFDLTIHPKLDSSKPSSPSTSPSHLRGRTNFGDSISDEWTIVYLLVELSKMFPSAWIRIHDTDGEFLLIEAANSLPKWLNPEIAENRIWINDGHLKILPLSSSDSTSRNLNIQAAIASIKTSSEKLLVDPTIEKEAFYRLREYPQAINSSLHHSLTSVPRRLAYILHRNPAYIAPAIEAFYLRDPISLKPLETKDTATLSFPPEDFVTVSLKFTKVGFAQLRSQIFDPPPAWTSVIPRMQDEKVARGMKLTCGFEMLVSDHQNQDKRSVREIKLLLEDVESGEESLPNDEEIREWPRIEDDEKWLDIDYNDFENELSGKAAGSTKDGEKSGFGDQGAQENLRKMVSRFQDFLEDDEAGAEGVDGDIDEMDDDDDDESSKSGEEDSAEDEVEDEKSSATDEAEFEKSIKKTMTMPTHHIEESGLLDEARKLALQDDEDADSVDEDEEMRKVIELMEKELKGHGALDLNADGSKGKGKGKGKASVKTEKKVAFGPEKPPHMQVQKQTVRFDDGTEEEVGPGDEELSSDEEDYNDVDLGLAKNMLEAFKGQAGMAGPAGNLMKALGVGMPRDEEEG